MDKDKINLWLAMNAESFSLADLPQIKSQLEQVPDDKLYLLQGTTFEKPTIILIIAILLGWERFWLDDVALGIVKIITCYGCGIWWLVDICTAKERTLKYNYRKFLQMTQYV